MIRLQNAAISKKLSMAIAILLLPTSLLIYFLIIEKSGLIEFTRKEIAGVQYLRALQQGFATSIALDFDKNKATSAADALQKAELNDGGALSLTAATAEAVAALRGGNASDAAAKIADAISAASDNSNITLDPDADTYFVGDMLVNQTKTILQKTSALVKVAQVLQKGKTESALMDFAVARDGLASGAGNFSADMSKAAKGNADGRFNASIGNDGKDVTALADKLIAAASADDYAAVITLAPNLMRSVSAILPKLNNEMVRLLDARISGFQSLLFTRIGISLAIIFLGGLIALLVARSITVPIHRIVDAMARLARSDYTAQVEGATRGDEIGEVARTLEIFKVSLMEGERIRSEQAAQDVAQKAEQQRQVQRGKDIETSVLNFDTVSSQVIGIVTSAATELEATAKSMASTSDRTTNQANTVAATAEATGQNVQTVASAAEELSASFGEVNAQVAESTKIIREAVTEASATREHVRTLEESAGKIGDVVKLITDIAEQTNLLALNATIEAARAGEAGKGFAVVASEVKALANQTANATNVIRSQISNMQKATVNSAGSIAIIAKTIDKLSAISEAIAGAVEQQTGAVREISARVAEASTGTTEVSESIQSVSQAAQETGAAASQVLSAASELAKNGEALKSQVDNFLREVRAA